MKTLLEENPRLAEAHEKYAAFTRDDELRAPYEARMKWKRDYVLQHRCGQAGGP